MAVFDPKTKEFYCECECGTIIPWYNSYARGHYWKTEEGRSNVSERMSDLVYDEGRNKRVSKGLLELHRLDSTIGDSISDSKSGTIHSDESRENMRKEQARRREEEPGIYDRISTSKLGTCPSAAERTTKSKAMLKVHVDDPTLADRMSDSHYGIIRGSEECKAISKGLKEDWKGLNSEERERRIKVNLRNLGKITSRKPTGTEVLLDEWLQESYPGEWKYVGNNEVRIGNKNPDFININGKKAVIELFGSYHHGLAEVTGGSRSEDSTITHYKKYGFDCLVIWVDYPDDLVLEWHVVTRWIKSL